MSSSSFCFFPFQIDLSHNRVPFVTSKMFPEHKWIPYKLEHLDLSHNNMPVITKDMLVGTKHLKYLNISYNILTDIRKGNAEKGLSLFDRQCQQQS